MEKKDATPPWCWRWFRHFPMSPPRPLESQISTRLSETCKGQAASGKRQKVGCCPDQHAHSTHGLSTDNFHSFRSYVAFPTSHRIRRSPLKFLANPWRKVAHQKNPEIIESLNSMAMCLGQTFTIIRWRCNSQNMSECSLPMLFLGVPGIHHIHFQFHIIRRIPSSSFRGHISM